MRNAARVLGLLVALAGGAGGAACARPSTIERAQQLVRLHREPEAAALLRAHLTAHPTDLPARRLYVRVLAFSGDLAGARREVETIERMHPNDPTAWIEMGHAFELAHQFDEALAAYDTAASAAPNSPAGPREGGMRAARWGEPSEAAPRLEEAIRRGANDAEIFHALGLVRVNLRDFDAAKAAYERGLAASPKSSENLLGLATVAIMRGDATAALAAYDALLRAKPRYAAAQLGRAWALAKLGRQTEAAQALDRAAELGAAPTNVEKLRAGMKSGDL